MLQLMLGCLFSPMKVCSLIRKYYSTFLQFAIIGITSLFWPSEKFGTHSTILGIFNSFEDLTSETKLLLWWTTTSLKACHGDEQQDWPNRQQSNKFGMLQCLNRCNIFVGLKHSSFTAWADTFRVSTSWVAMGVA